MHLLSRRSRRALCILTVLPLLMAACSDYKESSYVSMADARRVGAVDRGWLPDILPDGATNVRERHNIDTNETWCTFDLAAPDAAGLRVAMSPLKPSDVSARTVRAPGVGWWPKELEGTLDSRAIENAGMKMYTSGSLLFALEAGERRGFMYRAHAR